MDIVRNPSISKSASTLNNFHSVPRHRWYRPCRTVVEKILVSCSGGSRLVKLEGLSPSILWCPKGATLNWHGLGLKLGELDSELGGYVLFPIYLYIAILAHPQNIERNTQPSFLVLLACLFRVFSSVDLMALMTSNRMPTAWPNSFSARFVFLTTASDQSDTLYRERATCLLKNIVEYIFTHFS